MTWPLREVPCPWSDEDLSEDERRSWEPGLCWRTSPLTPESIQAPEWRRSGREYFIWVVLPGGSIFSPDRMSGRGQCGWLVSGELPLITVTPSIGAAEYHGFIRDGALTDDLEGRQYPAPAPA